MIKSTKNKKRLLVLIPLRLTIIKLLRKKTNEKKPHRNRNYECHGHE